MVTLETSVLAYSAQGKEDARLGRGRDAWSSGVLRTCCGSLCRLPPGAF
jgi:hypothetical protein